MFKFPWNLTDLESVPSNGRTVFSAFHCAGGSTMGYKLAGYTVLGGVEIDPEIMSIYRLNHKPKHSYLMGIEQFNKIPRAEIPSELFDLDILDGSPPCSSFSMAGSREKKWGVKSHFREGQSEQVLDDLFFHFIETARILQPKVVIAENVKGLVHGKAKGYVQQINQMFKHAGYDVQLFLLNAAFMGVPQKRERVFFIARRKGLNLEPIKIVASQKPITCMKAFEGLPADNTDNLSGTLLERWKRVRPGNFDKTQQGNTFGFFSKEHPEQPMTTITSACRNYHFSHRRLLNAEEIMRGQSFPDDFKCPEKLKKYICGMSVPPIMMANISEQLYYSWLRS